MKTTLMMVAAWCVLQGQSAPPAATPKFEIVSVKPCKPGIAGNGEVSPRTLSTGCALLADVDNTGVIQRAYNRFAGGHAHPISVIPIEGGPEWIHTERFEIDAKSDGRQSMEMMEGPMMQAVLEERFKLKIHRETRTGPVYEIALGKGSPRLKPLQDGSCISIPTLGNRPVLSSDQHYCRNMVDPRGAVDMEGGTVSTLAGLLGLVLDRRVIDKTGLEAQFEIHLVFSPDDSAPARPSAADPGAPAGVTSRDAPGIFQAMQQQLGLKLVPAKGPVDVLVIDHIERPSENN